MSVVPPTNITKVAVFGAGQFGFALATLLGANNPKMQIVLYDPVKVQNIFRIKIMLL
jgi:glycerol-3-phosphate dehydrogenase